MSVRTSSTGCISAAKRTSSLGAVTIAQACQHAPERKQTQKPQIARTRPTPAATQSLQKMPRRHQRAIQGPLTRMPPRNRTARLQTVKCRQRRQTLMPGVVSRLCCTHVKGSEASAEARSKLTTELPRALQSSPSALACSSAEQLREWRSR